MILIIPFSSALIDCQGVMEKGDLPCLVISSWSFNCSANTIKIFNEEPNLLRIAPLGDFGATSRCNITFGIQENETQIGSYLLNWSTGDSSQIIVQEDNDMLIALMIGISLIVALFIFLTFAVKDDKPFLANFFFLGIFIFTTVLCNFMWKIAYVNSAPYEPILLIVYRIFLIITWLMMLVVLVMLTVEVVQVRKIAGNPVDHYRDNLGKNE